MNRNPRYVFSGNVGLILTALSEVMLRTNSGETTPEEMLIVKATAFEGNHAALMFSGNDDNHTRRAWLTTTRTNTSNALVWFSGWQKDVEFVDETVLYDSHNNIYPDVTRCHSCSYLYVTNALEAIEEYILKGTFPMHTMPPGHLASLTG